MIKETFICTESIAFGDMIYYADKKYRFVEYFDETTGFLARSNILNNGIETDVKPNMRSFPELLDIGIMGHCDACCAGVCRSAGVDCYQNAAVRRRSNMTAQAYSKLIQQCKGKAFQVALGGAGDPNKHEEFEEILKLTRENLLVPNLTTSGFALTDAEIGLIRKYCGAVAVSFYSKLDNNGQETNQLTITAIERFLEAGCSTNIHYVLGKHNIDEAIYRVKNGLFPKGINAIVFLLYKAAGQARKENVLSINDPRYVEFLKLVNGNAGSFKMGFDSCQSPAINKFCPDIAKETIEFCDSARFSMYIDCDLRAYPCSFAHDLSDYAVDLSVFTIKEAWESEQFAKFRNSQCVGCDKYDHRECRGCSLDIGIDMCHTILL